MATKLQGLCIFPFPHLINAADQGTADTALEKRGFPHNPITFFFSYCFPGITELAVFMSKVSIIKGTRELGDSHLAGQPVGRLGPLVGRGDHGWEAPLALLLFVVFCVPLLVRTTA